MSQHARSEELSKDTLPVWSVLKSPPRVSGSHTGAPAMKARARMVERHDLAVRATRSWASWTPQRCSSMACGMRKSTPWEHLSKLLHDSFMDAVFRAESCPPFAHWSAAQGTPQTAPRHCRGCAPTTDSTMFSWIWGTRDCPNCPMMRSMLCS